MTEEEKDIPASGAVFTFGRSRFADNIPSHFFIRNDPIVDIGCGDEHTAVVCQNGRVFVFGSNEAGQLGLGHCSIATKPSCVKSLKPEQATHIACGRAHTIISTGSGKVFGCGSNSEGQLGVGDTEDKNVPSLVEGLTGTVEQLAAGSHHSVALNHKGEVFVWGSNADGQLGLGHEVKCCNSPVKLHVGQSVVKIACGYYHTVLLTEEGQVLVCGEGEGGKLGLGTVDSVYSPTTVTLDAWPVHIAAGGNHSLAVSVDGKVYGWGSNHNGQLGLLLKEHNQVLSPSLIHSLSGRVIREVSCGESHSAFVTELGELFTCGETRHGKLGIESSTSDPNCESEPTRVPRFKAFCVTKVSCGGCHTMVLASPRVDDTDDHLSNGHMLHPPEVDIVSPPIGARGSLPPLQRVPHISASSMDDKSSLYRRDSADSVLDKVSDPDVVEEPANGDEIDADVGERDSPVHKSTPDTVSVTEKSIIDHEEDNKSTGMTEQIFENKEQTNVEEICERAVSKTKSAIEPEVGKEKSIVATKINNLTKKSKMCILL